jgi:signal transduction histidine kinase
VFKTKGKDLTLTFVEPKGEIPPVFVDPERVTEVLVNLIDNAIKYTHVGLVRVSVHAQGPDSPVVVRVTDTGIGIDVEDRQHIFQKFYRPHRPTEEHKAGLSLGLGLYICSKFLRSMGGDIWIENTAPGKGTTFAFSLPTKPGGVCAEMAEQEEDEAGQSAADASKKADKPQEPSDDGKAAD